MNRLGIIAAFPGELQPLVGGKKAGWRPVTLREGLKGDAAWEGRIGQVECLAVAAGMGRDAAARACGIAESVAAKKGGLDALISLGWAGALSCGLSAGQAYWVAEVVNAGSGERFDTSFAPPPGPHLTLVTTDHVAHPPEKRRLAESYRAVLVDMEAATVAHIARNRGIAFYCLKAVSDMPGDILPDFSRYADAQGKVRIPGLLAHSAIRPKHWRPLARMGKNSKIGARALAEGLRKFIGNEKNADDSRHETEPDGP